MQRVSRTFAIAAFVVTLVVPTLALSTTSPASAAQARWGTPSSSQAIDWLADNIALTRRASESSREPGKVTTPILCPIVAKLAAPPLQTVVEQQCLAIGASADPWAALQAFTPLLCTAPGLFFPNYEDVFVLACKILA